MPAGRRGSGSAKLHAHPSEPIHTVRPSRATANGRPPNSSVPSSGHRQRTSITSPVAVAGQALLHTITDQPQVDLDRCALAHRRPRRPRVLTEAPAVPQRPGIIGRGAGCGGQRPDRGRQHDAWRWATRGERRCDPFHEPGVEPAGPDILVGQQTPDEPDVRRQAEDRRVRQRVVEAAQSLVAIGSPGDHLGQQRVVGGPDLGARQESRVDPHVRAARLRQAQDRAAGGQEARHRILGVHPRLDGVAGRGEVGLRERQRLAGGDAELQLHQVDSPHQLGDRVLDLEAGVHLHEVRGRRDPDPTR